MRKIHMRNKYIIRKGDEKMKKQLKKLLGLVFAVAVVISAMPLQNVQAAFGDQKPYEMPPRLRNYYDVIFINGTDNGGWGTWFLTRTMGLHNDNETECGCGLTPEKGIKISGSGHVYKGARIENVGEYIHLPNESGATKEITCPDCKCKLVVARKRYPHPHNWVHVIEGNTVKAYCNSKNQPEQCQYQGIDNAVSVTISVEKEAPYTGKPFAGIKLEGYENFREVVGLWGDIRTKCIGKETRDTRYGKMKYAKSIRSIDDLPSAVGGYTYTVITGAGELNFDFKILPVETKEDASKDSTPQESTPQSASQGGASQDSAQQEGDKQSASKDGNNQGGAMLEQTAVRKRLLHTVES